MDYDKRTDIGLVTGVDCREDEYSTPLRLGNPNSFTKKEPDELTDSTTETPTDSSGELSITDYTNNDIAFIMYPNPVISNLMITSDHNLTDIWIVPAQAEKIYQDTDFSSILHSKLYSETEIESRAELTINNTTGGTLQVNADDLSPGYYKVFVKINGEFYWDNLIKQGNATGFEDIYSIMNFWNN